MVAEKVYNIHTSKSNRLIMESAQYKETVTTDDILCTTRMLTVNTADSQYINVSKVQNALKRNGNPGSLRVSTPKQNTKHCPYLGYWKVNTSGSRRY